MSGLLYPIPLLFKEKSVEHGPGFLFLTFKMQIKRKVFGCNGKKLRCKTGIVFFFEVWDFA